MKFVKMGHTCMLKWFCTNVASMLLQSVQNVGGNSDGPQYRYFIMFSIRPFVSHLRLKKYRSDWKKTYHPNFTGLVKKLQRLKFLIWTCTGAGVLI